MNFYRTKSWEILRERILRMDGYVDQVALRLYGRRLEANTVHHIYPRREYPQFSLAPWNLVSVSDATHNALENRTTGELSELGKQLQRLTAPGVDWRRRGSPRPDP